jgi:hypothetical protein
MSKSVLSSGQGYNVSPKDGTKLKTSVSESFKSSGTGAAVKTNPLQGGGEKVTASVQIHDNKPNSWVKGGAKGKPTPPDGRKKHTYGS